MSNMQRKHFTSSSSPKEPNYMTLGEALQKRHFFRRLHKTIAVVSPILNNKFTALCSKAISPACFFWQSWGMKVMKSVTEIGTKHRIKLFKNTIQLTNISLLFRAGKELGAPFLSLPSRGKTVELTDAPSRTALKTPPPKSGQKRRRSIQMGLLVPQAKLLTKNEP